MVLSMKPWFISMPMNSGPGSRTDWNYFNRVDNIIPKLLQAGVSPGQIDLMTRDNLRRIFVNVGPP